MSRDYARKDRPAKASATSRTKPARQTKPKAARPKPKASARAQHGSLSLKWILSLAAVGGFIGFIVYLNSLPTSPHSQQPSVTEKPVQKPAKTPAETAKEEEKPGFRFYEMLPESEVVPPKVEEYTPGPTQTDFNYLLQSGSFRSKEDAERQRAQIAFQGLRASTQRIDLDNGSVWYRVNVGPFTSRSQMNSAIDKLVSLNIQPLVRKIPKEG
ncbi:sporulation protein [Marinobacter sp. CP1]|jgi:cell division septation protein DedD|uniref:SPOR domain-containing protein n=1 Tax=Marinobacter adhaerens TaxID=1033846 RepID=A0A352IQ09_9GAMM|nr:MULTISPECIES: SPOR domain-containing protein [unclassified Marinobacter]AKV97082.1 sporulation protein [Marinobacter sp. CP1]HBC33542.1 SPOR domain-containing protein [Marinobacter adhaerens]|tara:strand:+ start:1302 stop:1940 length:639 start_codon:yes stop_codon:yes gene_type:complete